MNQPAEPIAPIAQKRSWPLRFTLKSLLWVMLCIALSTSAYRWGVEEGRREAWRNRAAVGSPYVATYYVADLAELTKSRSGVVADFDPLINDIQRSVFPKTWTDAGGSASIAAFVTNMSLVVVHDKEGHKELANFLEAKRREQGLDGSGRFALNGNRLNMPPKVGNQP